MLSYRHAFHAGNHADVLKHLTLVALFQHFLAKDNPFTYLESHAGNGYYDLTDAMAQKNAEFDGGVEKLWRIESVDPVLKTYRDLLRQVNHESGGGTLRYYPGSPTIAKLLCRPDDKMILMEMHPREIALLRENTGGDSRIHLHCRDGFEGLAATVPPTPRRGLALIDPAYEVKSDYERAVTCVETIHRKWQTGVIALWYPLLAQERDRAEWLKRKLLAANLANLLQVELRVLPQQLDVGMHGSGMLIVNPPWRLDESLAATLNEIAALLAPAVDVPIAIQWLKEKR